MCKAPSGLFGGHRILLNQFSVSRLWSPLGTEVLAWCCFSHRSAVVIRTLILSLGHSDGHHTWSFLSHSLGSFCSISKAHMPLTRVLNHSSLFPMNWEQVLLLVAGLSHRIQGASPSLFVVLFIRLLNDLE